MMLDQFTYDKSSNAAYLQLVEVEDSAGIVAETIPMASSAKLPHTVILSLWLYFDIFSGSS